MVVPLRFAAMLDNLEIRDPVHGFVYRDSHERDIIDTKVFQRLRSLHQLALAHLVYPGAVHTRFDHSLGAFHVAAGLAKVLVDSESDKRLVRLATLLHDVGHGPFSPRRGADSPKPFFSGLLFRWSGIQDT